MQDSENDSHHLESIPESLAENDKIEFMVDSDRRMGRSNSIDKLFLEKAGQIYYTSVGTEENFDRELMTNDLSIKRKSRSRSELKKLFGSENTL